MSQPRFPAGSCPDGLPGDRGSPGPPGGGPMVTESVLPDSEEDHLTDLPETRAVIEQAKGIVMATYRCGPDEASDMLRQASRARGIKVYVLAAKLVELARSGLTITDVGHRKTYGLPVPGSVRPSRRPGTSVGYVSQVIPAVWHVSGTNPRAAAGAGADLLKLWLPR